MEERLSQVRQRNCSPRSSSLTTILTADSAPFLQDISQNPKEIAELLEGFNSWAIAWIAAESSGPYLNSSTTVVVANPADLGLAVLGGADVNSYLSAGLGPGYVNPATYGSAGSIPANAGAALTSAIEDAPRSGPAGTRTNRRHLPHRRLH